MGHKRDGYESDKGGWDTGWGGVSGVTVTTHRSIRPNGIQVSGLKTGWGGDTERIMSSWRGYDNIIILVKKSLRSRLSGSRCRDFVCGRYGSVREKRCRDCGTLI
jgi:hypothetical protein